MLAVRELTIIELVFCHFLKEVRGGRLCLGKEDETCCLGFMGFSEGEKGKGGTDLR